MQTLTALWQTIVITNTFASLAAVAVLAYPQQQIQSRQLMMLESIGYVENVDPCERAMLMHEAFPQRYPVFMVTVVTPSGRVGQLDCRAAKTTGWVVIRRELGT